MAPRVVLNPKRSFMATLLLAASGLTGCSGQAPDGRAGAGGASGTERAAGSARNELVVGFLPVT